MFIEYQFENATSKASAPLPAPGLDDGNTDLYVMDVIPQKQIL
jgi:hypothetical protein